MAEGTALIGQQMHMYNGGMYQRTQYAIKTYVPKLGHQTGLQYGLWNITDVLEFPSTLMEQRTLDARGVLRFFIEIRIKVFH